MAVARGPYASIALAGVAVGLVVVAFVGAIALLNSDGPTLEPGWAGVLPLLGLVALPAVLAVVGLRRPAALLAAGVLSVPAAFLSFAGVTLPLLIPAAFYLVAYGRAPASHPRLAAPLIAVLVVVGSVGSFMASLSTDRTVCTETIVYGDGRTVERTTNESEASVISSGEDRARVVEMSCSDGVPTLGGVAVSAVLLATTALGAAWLSKPR